MVAVGIEDGDWDSSKMAERRNKNQGYMGHFPTLLFLHLNATNAYIAGRRE
jgi:hypothetical protein